MHATLTRRSATVAAAALLLGAATLVAAAVPSSATAGRSEGASASDRSAVSFLAGVVRLLAANRYAAAWTTLNPRQQSLVTRSDYVRCESQSPIPGHLREIHPTEVRHELVTVPGASSHPTASTVVKFRLRIVDSASAASVVVHVKAHALRIGGHWRWMLSKRRLNLDSSSVCGSPGANL